MRIAVIILRRSFEEHFGSHFLVFLDFLRRNWILHIFWSDENINNSLLCYTLERFLRSGTPKFSHIWHEWTISVILMLLGNRRKFSITHLSTVLIIWTPLIWWAQFKRTLGRLWTSFFLFIIWTYLFEFARFSLIVSARSLTASSGVLLDILVTLGIPQIWLLIGRCKHKELFLLVRTFKTGHRLSFGHF